MRIVSSIFQVILVFMMFSFIFTFVQAQENTEELRTRMGEIENRIHEIEDEQQALSNQLGGDLNEDHRQELEARLRDIGIEHETLHRELHDLRGNSIVEIIKQPTILAAIIGAIAIIIAALIRRSRRA